MEPEARRKLAETLRWLGTELQQGFTFRATWLGSPVEDEVVVSADELAALAADSKLNEFTRYRVPPTSKAGA